MAEVLEAVGGDGFLIARPAQTGLTRKYIIEITDGLIPALQRRGLTRTDIRTCTSAIICWSSDPASSRAYEIGERGRNVENLGSLLRPPPGEKGFRAGSITGP
jgi:hypothetical protein